jgi:hypothetical protein
VTEQEMESTLIASKEPEEWLRQMYYILSERVKQNNVSNDNNSAIAVFV